MKNKVENIDHWVTVYRVELLMDAYLLKTKLEFEEVEVQLLDEFTVEAAPFYSSAMGGVRVQVRESQKERATELLLREGYISSVVTKPNKIVDWLSKITLRIPIVKNFRWELRLLTFVGFLVLLMILPFAISSFPSPWQKLTKDYWCVERITYEGKVLQADHSLVLFVYNGCAESLSFSENGTVNFPEYEGALAPVSWNEYKDGIYIHSKDSYGDTLKISVFEGAYSVTIDGPFLELRSATTIILCEKRDL